MIRQYQSVRFCCSLCWFHLQVSLLTCPASVSLVLPCCICLQPPISSFPVLLSHLHLIPSTVQFLFKSQFSVYCCWAFVLLCMGCFGSTCSATLNMGFWSILVTFCTCKHLTLVSETWIRLYNLDLLRQKPGYCCM